MINLNPVTFDKFVKKLNPSDKQAIEIDLTQANFVSPAALTQLSALCHSFNREGKQITVKLNKEIGLYLVRSGFVKSVRPIAKILPKEFEQIPRTEKLCGTNPLLIEVTKIESLSSLPALLDRIVMVLLSKLEYHKYEAYDTVTALSEVCQNTFDHNNGVCGFIAMQTYSNGKNNSLEIGVSDFGEGLAATLKKNKNTPELRSDYEAIEYATRAGTSEYDDPTRGTGLYHLLQITYKNSGVAQIHSGDGKVRYKKDRSIKWDRTVPNLPGVHIVLQLSAKKYFAEGLDKVF